PAASAATRRAPPPAHYQLTPPGKRDYLPPAQSGYPQRCDPAPFAHHWPPADRPAALRSLTALPPRRSSLAALALLHLRFAPRPATRRRSDPARAPVCSHNHPCPPPGKPHGLQSWHWLSWR